MSGAVHADATTVPRGTPRSGRKSPRRHQKRPSIKHYTSRSPKCERTKSNNDCSTWNTPGPRRVPLLSSSANTNHARQPGAPSPERAGHGQYEPETPVCSDEQLFHVEHYLTPTGRTPWLGPASAPPPKATGRPAEAMGQPDKHCSTWNTTFRPEIAQAAPKTAINQALHASGPNVNVRCPTTTVPRGTPLW